MRERASDSVFDKVLSSGTDLMIKKNSQFYWRKYWHFLLKILLVFDKDGSLPKLVFRKDANFRRIIDFQGTGRYEPICIITHHDDIPSGK
jgi:hypothetical protein